MGEMILNHASATPQIWSSQQAKDALIELAQGMSALIKEGATDKILRIAHPLEAFQIARDATLWDVLITMQRQANREEARLWLSLSQKLPLLADLDAAQLARFHGSQANSTHGAAKETLLLCFQLGACAISFHGAANFDCDALKLQYEELGDDGNILINEGEVDNLARSHHARTILARRAIRFFENVTHRTFWPQRQAVFPDLHFGLDVESQLAALGNHLFPTILQRLQELQQSAKEWKGTSASMPRWRSHVTPESSPLKNDDKKASKRKFRDAHGQTQIYLWHARFGDHRIHLRFDANHKIVEIGYIGAHLPL